MEPAVVDNAADDFDNFINFLYEGLEGYVYVAAKVPLSEDPKDWQGELIKYPEQKQLIRQIATQFAKTHEVYVAPAIFKDNTSHKKENVKATNVVWIDFDGNAPADWSDFAEGKGTPSWINQTSQEGHNHVYWKLESPLTDPKEIDRINRSLAYSFQADNSGWDAGQVLRPPLTYNHKGSGEVRVLSRVNVTYDKDLFSSLSSPSYDVPVSEWKLSELPDVQDVLLSHVIPVDVQRYLKMSKQDAAGKRSDYMMSVAYSLCQAGMQDNEVFAIIRMMDDNWGKYKGREDRNRRLADIIVRARIKYPDESPQSDTTATFAWPYKTFLAAEIKIDWVIEGMLMDYGNMLNVGMPGIGKTQFLLQAAVHVALGKDWLGYTISEPKKVGILSLEMGHPDLQIFMRAQDQALTAPERDLLQENLTIIPHGEAWPLNTPIGQERLKSVLDRFKFDGLFVDSVGKSIAGNISSNQDVQPFLNFNDHIRKEYGMFLWYVHHTRKGQPGAGPSGSLDDSYGDQYITASASSVYALLRAKDGNIRVRNTKNRLAKMEDDYFIKRTDFLGFERIEVPTFVPGQSNVDDTSTIDDGPTGAGGFAI